MITSSSPSRLRPSKRLAFVGSSELKKVPKSATWATICSIHFSSYLRNVYVTVHDRQKISPMQEPAGMGYSMHCKSLT